MRDKSTKDTPEPQCRWSFSFSSKIVIDGHTRMSCQRCSRFECVMSRRKYPSPLLGGTGTARALKRNELVLLL